MKDDCSIPPKGTCPHHFKLEKMVSEIHYEIVGSDQYDHPGFAKRLRSAESKICGLQKEKWIRLGMGILLPVVIPIIISLVCYIYMKDHKDTEGKHPKTEWKQYGLRSEGYR